MHNMPVMDTMDDMDRHTYIHVLMEVHMHTYPTDIKDNMDNMPVMGTMDIVDNMDDMDEGHGGHQGQGRGGRKSYDSRAWHEKVMTQELVIK